MQPKVSVIVPNYNHAPYLKQRLDSIFNQTFQDFEVIILDDCSTDNSRDIIETYREYTQVSHIVYNETNSGSPFKQWAKGFELAKGEYIWIAESDDWAEPSFLDELHGHFQNNKELCLTFSDSLFVYSDKKEHQPTYPNDTEILGSDFIKEKMLYSNVIVNASAVLFRKSSIPQDSTYQQYKTAGDYLFWTQICENGKIFYKNKCLNNFRKHASNTTELNLNNGILFEEEHRVFQHLKKRFNIPKQNQTYVALYWKNRLNTLESLASSNSLKIIKQAKKNWESDIRHPFLAQTFCYTRLLILQLLPNTISQRFQQPEQFKNIGVLGLLWRIFHLPNTNLRRIFFK